MLVEAISWPGATEALVMILFELATVGYATRTGCGGTWYMLLFGSTGSSIGGSGGASKRVLNTKSRLL